MAIHSAVRGRQRTDSRASRRVFGGLAGNDGRAKGLDVVANLSSSGGRRPDDHFGNDGASRPFGSVGEPGSRTTAAVASSARGSPFGVHAAHGLAAGR